MQSLSTHGLASHAVAVFVVVTMLCDRLLRAMLDRQHCPTSHTHTISSTVANKEFICCVRGRKLYAGLGRNVLWTTTWLGSVYCSGGINLFVPANFVIPRGKETGLNAGRDEIPIRLERAPRSERSRCPERLLPTRYGSSASGGLPATFDLQ